MDKRSKKYRHRNKSVMDVLREVGHDENFDPQPSAGWVPTGTLIGSPERVEVYARRVELGQPLWHPFDATGAVHVAESRGLGQLSLGKWAFESIAIPRPSKRTGLR